MKKEIPDFIKHLIFNIEINQPEELFISKSEDNDSIIMTDTLYEETSDFEEMYGLGLDNYGSFKISVKFKKNINFNIFEEKDIEVFVSKKSYDDEEFHILFEFSKNQQDHLIRNIIQKYLSENKAFQEKLVIIESLPNNIKSDTIEKNFKKRF